MNSSDRVLRRMRGESVDRIPCFNIVMAFACHLIGRPLSSFYLDHRILAEASFAAHEAFNIDILQAISDPYREAADLGVKVEFPDDGLPLRKAVLLEETADIQKLVDFGTRPGKRMTDRIDGVRMMREMAADDVPVMGWVEGALAEMNVLRGDSQLMLDLYDRPEWVKDCLELITQIEVAFACTQIEAGATIIGLGDAIASQVSPSMYEEYALPCEQRIFEVVHSAGALARLHICGNTNRILPLMARSGADIIDLDWMVDLSLARRTFGDGGPVICGNFDPVRLMLNGTQLQVKEAVRQNLNEGGNRLISMPGCEIPDGTPHANLHAQTEVLREAGCG